jgi:hypothetical protein
MGVENNGNIFGLEKDLETFVGDKRNKAVFKIISLSISYWITFPNLALSKEP